MADMITDSVTDLKNAVLNATYFEKDEAKKVEYFIRCY